MLRLARGVLGRPGWLAARFWAGLPQTDPPRSRFPLSSAVGPAAGRLLALCN
jgi:hypothetical protein